MTKKELMDFIEKVDQKAENDIGLIEFIKDDDIHNEINLCSKEIIEEELDNGSNLCVYPKIFPFFETVYNGSSYEIKGEVHRLSGRDGDELDLILEICKVFTGFVKFVLDESNLISWVEKKEGDEFKTEEIDLDKASEVIEDMRKCKLENDYKLFISNMDKTRKLEFTIDHKNGIGGDMLIFKTHTSKYNTEVVE